MKSNEVGNNPNYKTNFNPDNDTNPLRKLSQQFNKPNNEECPEESPLIRLAKQLNPEHTNSSSDIATDTENPSNKPKTETTVIKAERETKDKSINILTFARNLSALAENITDYLKNDRRLSIETIFKSVAEIARLTNNQSFLITSSYLYKKLNNAKYGSKKMYQAGNEIASFTTNSLIPYLKQLDLKTVSDLTKKNIQAELAKIAELIVRN